LKLLDTRNGIIGQIIGKFDHVIKISICNIRITHVICDCITVNCYQIEAIC